ncbi:hypothetical protein TNCV_2803621 [Trichonephila clavipes]|nr:hypothetical protein TNCV_2803621 [Trichonephila clavipes]
MRIIGNGLRYFEPLSSAKDYNCDLPPTLFCGRGSLVVKTSDRGSFVTSSSPVALKTRRVEARCTLNLSRAQTSSRWCGVVVRRATASSGVVHVT